jgi:hypothetical protein
MVNRRSRSRGWAKVLIVGVAATVFATAAAPVVAGSPVVDTVVTNTTDSGTGSLRQAILNANDHIGPDTISFSIGTGPQTITLLSPLPPVTDLVTINGFTQPGFAGKPIIELDGTSAGGGPGLLLAAGHITVSGLVINRFAGDGIYAAVGFNGIFGNYIGTNTSGTIARGNSGNGVVLVGNFASSIGGPDPLQRNVISGNLDKGIAVFGGAGSNRIQGNLIGTDAAGAVALGNGTGIFVINSADNLIGGEASSGAGNLVSGNGGGINILGSGTTHTVVQGNLIGTDLSGLHPLGNAHDGIFVNDSTDNLIGGRTAAARNLISGNRGSGVAIVGATSTRNVAQGNYIGTDITGSYSVGNSLGVVVGDVPGNVVGGTEPGSGNVVSGNNGHGVLIYGSQGTHNVVQGNLVGTDSSGKVALANATWGVVLDGAPGNTIGGTSPAARNVLSGNGFDGMLITGVGASGNYVQGNFVGTDLTGTAPVGNHFNGIAIVDANRNTIGGTGAGAGNLIAFNPADGVVARSGTGNIVRGNSITSNGGLGIDLGDDGVTTNDRGDADSGANNLQNFPVLTTAIGTPVQLVIVGSIDTTDANTLVVDIYASVVADSSGFGEGQTLIGSVTPTSAGRFTLILAPQPKGTVISATATDSHGNTSEFARDVVVGP